jgi:hypothetical protein
MHSLPLTPKKKQKEWTLIQLIAQNSETWAMTVTEQNRLLVFERRVLRKIYGPTQDNDGAWRIKANEELENLINKKIL